MSDPAGMGPVTTLSICRVPKGMITPTFSGSTARSWVVAPLTLKKSVWAKEFQAMGSWSAPLRSVGALIGTTHGGGSRRGQGGGEVQETPERFCRVREGAAPDPAGQVPGGDDSRRAYGAVSV